jgi:hypothetical protein
MFHEFLFFIGKIAPGRYRGFGTRHRVNDAREENHDRAVKLGQTLNAEKAVTRAGSGYCKPAFLGMQTKSAP